MTDKSGKISVALVVGIAVLVLTVFFDPFTFHRYSAASADTATTTVTVLNTPPEWAVDAQEYIESSTSSPTNAGSNVIWIGTASDSNNENYYMIVCATSTVPTPHASSSPTCSGGTSTLWAVSVSTPASQQATSTYTSTSTNAEQNSWFAFICDGNASNPSCNGTYKQGTGNTASPFFINHRPSFTVVSDNSPANPGATVTWTTTASDADVVDTADTVRLWVCRANDFVTSTCGVGGTYCSSTLSASNPTCLTNLSSTLQDKNYTSFAYIVDNHNFTSTLGVSATDTVLTVSNVAPTISSSSISLNDTDLVGNLTLTAAQGTTTGFTVKFTVADNNSCSSTSNLPEISVSSTFFSVYRSGIGSSSCQTAGNYNPNNCYPSTLATSTWQYGCVQDAGSCTGAADSDATFTCTFPLWYLADPTDGADATSTQFFAQNWLAAVRATDDNAATTSLTVASTGNELLSYLAYTLTNSSIVFGSLAPGSSTDPLTPTTTVRAIGNVGLDETLYGDHMCTTYPTCSPSSTTSTIQVYYQKYATSGVGYASSSAVAATSSPGSELEINILKTTATSSPAFGTTYWGIQVPVALTLAGDYTGKNTIIGITGEAQSW